MGSGEEPRKALTDQAVDWLVGLDAGNADPEAFEQWRSADPRHAAAFAQVAAVWRATGDLHGFRSLQKPGPEPLAADAPPVAGRRAFITGLAASVAVIAAGGGYLLSSRRAYAETAVGERRVVQLPDGSHVELNTDTRIGWQMGAQLGLWIEQGEAAITVVEGLAHPFKVEAASMRAVLTHGRYNVRLAPSRASLIAFSGKAMVSGNHGAQMTLQAGQSLDAGEDGLHAQTLSAGQIEVASAWQHGMIVFDGMPLSAALGEFNRYLPRPIELGEAALGSVRLGGRFNTDDPQGFLQALHDSFGIEHSVQGNHIVLVSSR